jgi:hypothetical protein
VSEEDILLSYRVQSLEKDRDEDRREFKEAVKSIDASLQTLARLEQRHLETREGLERAFSAITNQESRVKAIELEMPTLKMVKGWIISGALFIVAGVAVAAGGIILHYQSQDNFNKEHHEQMR